MQLMINDILKKTQSIVDNKIVINKTEPEEVKYFIVYLLHNDDIVYIGKASDVIQYVAERKDKYASTHYYFEEVSAIEIDNYLAFLILEIQPIYNIRINNNSKYISSSAAKRDYFIDKNSFKKVYKGWYYQSFLSYI